MKTKFRLDALILTAYFICCVNSFTSLFCQDSQQKAASPASSISQKYDEENALKYIKVQKVFEQLDLKGPRNIEENKNQYFILDDSINAILVVDKKTQKIVKQIGKLGQGPGEFFNPGYMRMANGKIAVFEHRNKRFQILKTDGSYVSEFPDSPFPWKAFSMTSSGAILLGQPQKGSLISIYDVEGKNIGSFGSLKEASDIYGEQYIKYNQKYLNAINRVCVYADQDDGNIYVVYIFAPILQKYDGQGHLLVEARIEGKEVEDYKSYFPETTKPTALIKSPMDGVTIYNYFLSVVIDKKTKDLIVLTGRGNIYIYDRKTLQKKREIIIPYSLYRGAIHDLCSLEDGLYFTTAIVPGIYKIEIIK